MAHTQPTTLPSSTIATITQRAALVGALCYLALFPGSTLVVALGAVPAWGEWMGGALLLLQGIAALAWLVGSYGRRGAAAAAGAGLLAWAVEHLGETTGQPFGRYAYTDMLQPQILGVVPIAITCAWLMVALGSWQLAERAVAGLPRRQLWGALLTATLVVTLDLQIETIATIVNRYWVWYEAGPYYGVPPQNFLGWWGVGLAMALLMRATIGDRRPARLRAAPSWSAQLFANIPTLLYLASSLMFTVVNLAQGHTLAGLVGVIFLATVAARAALARR